MTPGHDNAPPPPSEAGAGLVPWPLTWEAPAIPPLFAESLPADERFQHVAAQHGQRFEAALEPVEPGTPVWRMRSHVFDYPTEVAQVGLRIVVCVYPLGERRERIRIGTKWVWGRQPEAVVHASAGLVYAAGSYALRLASPVFVVPGYPPIADPWRVLWRAAWFMGLGVLPCLICPRFLHADLTAARLHAWWTLEPAGHPECSPEARERWFSTPPHFRDVSTCTVFRSIDDRCAIRPN